MSEFITSFNFILSAVYMQVFAVVTCLLLIALVYYALSKVATLAWNRFKKYWSKRGGRKINKKFPAIFLEALEKLKKDHPELVSDISGVEYKLAWDKIWSCWLKYNGEEIYIQINDDGTALAHAVGYGQSMMYNVNADEIAMSIKNVIYKYKVERVKMGLVADRLEKFTKTFGWKKVTVKEKGNDNGPIVRKFKKKGTILRITIFPKHMCMSAYDEKKDLFWGYFGESEVDLETYVFMDRHNRSAGYKVQDMFDISDAATDKIVQWTEHLD